MAPTAWAGRNSRRLGWFLDSDFDRKLQFFSFWRSGSGIPTRGGVEE